MTLPVLALTMGVAFGADELVYGETLAPNWYNWSWSSEVDFAATGDVATGQTAILANVGTFGGLSIQRESGFGSSSALRFKIKGQADGIVLRLESTADGATDEREIPVTDEWTEMTVSLDALAALGWNRIAWVDTTGLGATLRVDDIELLDDDPAAVAWRSAEPLGRSRVVLYGAGDPETVTLRLDGQPLAVSGTVSESGPARVYFDLEEPLGSGLLEVETADATFERSILDRTLTVDDVVSHVIPPEVYGANFPDDPPNASAMARYRYGAVRWGGNARALYNPATRTTNVGDDFYYLNVFVNPALEEWSRLVDVPSVVTVPNLDWVANGTLGWSFSVDKYGPQESVAPINDDAGDGYDLAGNPITGNDPTDACEPWTPADATAWLETLETTPSILAIGNETDIAHITHRSIYPDAASYDDQLRHFLDYANAAKDALPTVPVSGPVGCCWFFYWNSGDPADASTYGDFLPWFLDEVAAADALSGRRTLDILDLHYYPENLIALDWKNQSTPAIDAWRLRSTRSLWDPDHIDESYVGEEPPVTDQPDADRVQLVPRMRQLIDDHYPGTQLMLSEWGFGDERGISGGLAAADALGIFGREQVDYAFMWPGPPTGSFAAAAFELFRGGGVRFGASSLGVTGGDIEYLGAYATLVDAETVALALVNKSPDFDLRLAIEGLEAGGRLELEHFGTSVGPRLVEHPASTFDGTIVVPAYSAVMLEVTTANDTTPPVVDPPGPTDPDEPSPTPPPTVGNTRCGSCSTPGQTGVTWLALVTIVAVLRRRQRP